MMRNIIYRVKSLITHEGFEPRLFNRKILDDTPSTYGLVRNSPQLRLVLKDYKKQNPEASINTSENTNLCELQKQFLIYEDLNSKNKMNIRIISELFDFLTKTKHDISDIEASMKMLLASPRFIDANFFTKGLFQSVLEHSPVKDQVDFFYFMEKINLIWPYTMVYTDNMEKKAETSQKEFKALDFDTQLKNYHTQSKLIDFKMHNIKQHIVQQHNKQHQWVSKLLKRGDDFSQQQLVDILESYSIQQTGSQQKVDLILHRLLNDYNLQDVDQALILSHYISELPHHLRNTQQSHYVKEMLELCYNKIHENRKEIKYPDQFVLLGNIILSKEYQKLVDSKHQLKPKEILSILNEEFGSKLHDVNKVDFINLVYKALSYSKDEKSKTQVRELIFDLCKDVPILSSTYHNEFSNRVIQRTMAPVIKHCNQELDQDNQKNMVYGNSWKAYSLLFTLKSILEYKKDYNHLNLGTLMNLIEVDVQSCKNDGQPSLLNREFGRYIVSLIDDNRMQDRHLNLIQKSIKKYSVAFPEPHETYKKCLEITLNKTLLQLQNL
eukprot:403355817